MAQVKRLFPSLTNAGGLFSCIAPHSALLSVAILEDQTTKTTERERFHIKIPKAVRWAQASVYSPKPLMFDQERIKSLCFAMEDDNDYEEGQKCSDFVHVLQLEEECNINELETVNSQCDSARSHKWQDMSETQSIDGDSSEVISLQ